MEGSTAMCSTSGWYRPREWYRPKSLTLTVRGCYEGHFAGLGQLVHLCCDKIILSWSDLSLPGWQWPHQQDRRGCWMVWWVWKWREYDNWLNSHQLSTQVNTFLGWRVLNITLHLHHHIPLSFGRMVFIPLVDTLKLYYILLRHC